MKTIIVNGTHRADGHTTQVVDILAEKMAADVVTLLDYTIGHYTYDYQHKDDDFLKLMERIATYDCILFATPIYWYQMSGRMKVFFDRITDCLKIAKPLGRSLMGTKVAAISCGSWDDCPSGFFDPFRLSAEYLDMQYLGDQHVWITDKEAAVSKECMERINSFVKKLIE